MSSERLIPLRGRDLESPLQEKAQAAEVPTSRSVGASVPSRVIKRAIAAALFVTFSLSAGLAMVGSKFDLNSDVKDTGVFNITSFFGMVLLIVFGTLGFLLWANCLPDMLLLDPELPLTADKTRLWGHPRFISLSLLAINTIMTAVGAGVCLQTMLRPANTYADTKLVGLADPQLVLVGSFLIIVLLFLALQSCTLFIFHWSPKWWMRRGLSREQWRSLHIVLFVLLCTFLLWVIG